MEFPEPLRFVAVPVRARLAVAFQTQNPFVLSLSKDCISS
jgi:hypothetical protein